MSDMLSSSRLGGECNETVIAADHLPAIGLADNRPLPETLSWLAWRPLPHDKSQYAYAQKPTAWPCFTRLKWM
jgi:hypothetical protein